LASKMAETPTAGTFNVEALSLTASLATLKALEKHNVPLHLDHMGHRFLDGMNRIIRDSGVEAQAKPMPLACMPQLFFTDKDEKKRARLMNAFYPGVMKRGLFLVDWHQSFIMYSHKESDIDEALNICEDAMKDARKKA